MLKIQRIEGSFSHADGSHTWYRRAVPDDPRDDALPLVVLHGGPGMAHNYLDRLDELSLDGREVIQYDQVGCGLSSHHPDAPLEHWTTSLFVGELATLVEHWDITGGFHLAGQSWGGMLGPEFVLSHPDGVASLSLLDSPASMPDWAQGTRRLAQALPATTYADITEHEASSTFDHLDYIAAVDEFYRRHLCRLDPWPDELVASLDQVAADPTVYHSMIGPSEFTITGTLAEWSVVERLRQINVPTLVAYGEHDEATDSWRPFAEHIPDAEVHEFAGASHTPHLETPAEFDRLMRDFLRRHDR